MVRSIYWYVCFVIALILETPNLIRSKRILEREGQAAYDEFVFGVTTRWAEKRLRQSGADIVVHNQERIPADRNVLFVSNHQSDFDIAIFMARIKKNAGFVAKIEMEKVPLLSGWMRAIHCVFMDRRDLKQSLNTIIEGIKILKKGYSVVVFPEGTRSKSSRMGEFKAGSFKLATKSGVPIVPVTIDGTYKIMEGNNYIIRPEHVDIYVHEPIYMEGLSKDEMAAVGDRVREIILEPIKDKQ